MVLVAICAVLLGCTDSSEDLPSPTSASANAPQVALELLNSELTGIEFSNTLNENINLNVFIWNFLYTGAGVAIGDINNDGLPDIYFAGNLVQDRLYLNKGSLKFEDITAASGIDGSGWSTGVTMADVNSDGFIDIYVCKNSPTAIAKNNKNKLFINRGDGTFIEQAEQLGLADVGFSVQATFFDLEQDGDLDMYLANQPFDQFARLVNDPNLVQQYPSTDRLFVQRNGRFEDVTGSNGLVNERYGLNVALSDVNQDGWTDLYVCNDYHHADHLYINNRGRLSDEIRARTGHISFYSMGSDVGDINNDGWPDISVLDMAFDDHYRSKTNMESMQPERFWSLVADGQHFQYAQNTLLLNRADGYFSDIAQVSGVAKTDWSAAPLFIDIDHDGLQDLLVTNGIMRDMKNNDFNDWVRKEFGGAVGPENIARVMQELPSIPVDNKAFQNKGALKFADVSEEWGFNLKGFSHGMAYGDLDRDGDLDVVINNMNAVAGIYENQTEGNAGSVIIELRGPGQNLDGLGLTVTACIDGQEQVQTMQSTRGFLSASEPIVHFGLGDADVVDSIVVVWNAQQATTVYDVGVGRTVIDYREAEKQEFKPKQASGISVQVGPVIDARDVEKPFDDYADQVLLPYKLSENGPFTATGDLNGDGHDDIWIGGGAGQAGYVLLHNTNDSYVSLRNTAFEADRDFEDMQGALFDADSDGDLDLYVVSGSNEFPEGSEALTDRLYVNDGTGVFARNADALPANLRINGQCVEPFDLEGDGDTDLFIGGRLIAGQYPLPANSAILQNDGGKFRDVTSEVSDGLIGMGLVTDATASDVDSDGDHDLVIVGEWMNPTVLVNNGGTLKLDNDKFSDMSGLWWAVEALDLDGDGDEDLLMGNLGWNNKFGGRDPHLSVYAGDLDENGDHDVVLASDKSGRILPVRGRECSSQEMPFILSQFASYDAFGRADVLEILPDLESRATMTGSISTFSSIVAINDGTGSYSTQELPPECQLGPIKAFASGDIPDHNGEVAVFCGNHFPTEVETARYDGIKPGLLTMQDGAVIALPFIHPEALRHADFRDAQMLPGTTANSVLLTRNNEKPLVIKWDH